MNEGDKVTTRDEGQSKGKEKSGLQCQPLCVLYKRDADNAVHVGGKRVVVDSGGGRRWKRTGKKVKKAKARFVNESVNPAGRFTVCRSRVNESVLTGVTRSGWKS